MAEQPPISATNRLLDTGDVQKNIGKLNVHGGIVTFIGQILTVAIQMGSTACLARILSPGDYGLVGMVMILVGLMRIFKDLGFSALTIQKSEITLQQVSNLFWVNTLFGAAVGLIFWCAAPLVAWFYGASELEAVTRWLALGFLLSGLMVQHDAILRRKMRLATTTAIEVSSFLLACGVAITCALAGMKFWSLVILQLSQQFFNMTGVWVASCWLPGLPRRGHGNRAMMRFGRDVTIYNLLNYFSRNFDNLLIGKFFGPDVLGLYLKAYSLLLMPITQINSPLAKVAVPTLSRLRAEPDRHRFYYLKYLQWITMVCCPIIAICFVMAEEIILVMLGPNWSGAVPLFQVFAFAAIAQPVANTMGWLYTDPAHSRALAKWAILSSSCTCLSFVLGIPWGPMGVALGYAVAINILRPIGFHYALRLVAINRQQIFKVVWRSYLSSFWVAFALFLNKYFFHLENLSGFLLLQGLTVLFVYLAMFVFWKAWRMEILDNINLVMAKNKGQ